MDSDLTTEQLKDFFGELCQELQGCDREVFIILTTVGAKIDWDTNGFIEQWNNIVNGSGEDLYNFYHNNELLRSRNLMNMYRMISFHPYPFVQKVVDLIFKHDFIPKKESTDKITFNHGFGKKLDKLETFEGIADWLRMGAEINYELLKLPEGTRKSFFEQLSERSISMHVDTVAVDTMINNTSPMKLYRFLRESNFYHQTHFGKILNALKNVEGIDSIRDILNKFSGFRHYNKQYF